MTELNFKQPLLQSSESPLEIIIIYAYMMLKKKKIILLSMFKTVVHLNIYVETVTLYFL